MDVPLAAALLAVGELRREDIPPIAQELLLEGKDSPNLRRLAGLIPPQLDEAHALFRQVLTELEHPIPTTDQAAQLIARDLAERTLAEGADLRAIARRGAHFAPLLEYHEALMPFYAADDEYDLPEIWPPATVDSRVLAYARSILGL